MFGEMLESDRVAAVGNITNQTPLSRSRLNRLNGCPALPNFVLLLPH
jgi:hypothetical protein